MSWVHCSKLVVNSFKMPIYYKRLEPFNSLVVSGSSWGLIACCQKGRSCKSSPSLLIVGLLFNSSRLCEATFYSTLLGGIKEVSKELNSWGRSQCEFNGECINSDPLSVASSASAAALIVAAHRSRFDEQLVALMALVLALAAAPVEWMDLEATSALLGAGDLLSCPGDAGEGCGAASSKGARSWSILLPASSQTWFENPPSLNQWRDLGCWRGFHWASLLW